MMLAITLSLMCGSAFAAGVSKDLSAEQYLDKEIPLEKTASPSGDEVYSLCRYLRIPCSEELLPDEKFLSGYSAARSDKLTVRQFLDDILDWNPNYIWHIEDGVLVVRPKAQPIKSPLEKRFGRFVRKDELFTQVIYEVADKVWIEPLSHAADEVGNPDYIDLLNKSAAQVIMIDCDEKTVREILNTAVRSHGHAMWTYRYPKPAGYFSGLFHRGSIDEFTY